MVHLRPKFLGIFLQNGPKNLNNATNSVSSITKKKVSQSFRIVSGFINKYFSSKGFTPSLVYKLSYRYSLPIDMTSPMVSLTSWVIPTYPEGALYNC